VRGGLHVDVEAREPDRFAAGADPERTGVDERHHLAVKWMPDEVDRLFRHQLRTAGGARSTPLGGHVWTDRDVGEPVLDLSACQGQRSVQCGLVERARSDGLTAGLPLGDHAVTDAQVRGELAHAHPARLAQRPDFPA
jgi:hypothetical protein